MCALDVLNFSRRYAVTLMDTQTEHLLRQFSLHVALSVPLEHRRF